MKDWPLNDSQYQTIREVLNRRLSLVQGPPGTGKTHTAIHLLLLLAKLYSEENIPILATACTNVATDNLLEGLRSRGVDALRIGQPVKVREELRNATLNSHLERHRQAEYLACLRSKLDSLKGDHYDQKLKQIKRLEATMVTDVVSKARVICCTCIGAGDPILNDQYFPLVVIDEATQALEPAVLVPIIKGAQQVIFFGDHYQLPPTVRSPKAEILKDSLFHRLVQTGNLKPFILQYQYRMHPMISQFPNKHFYKDLIKDKVNPSERPLPKGFKWIDKKPLIFLHFIGNEKLLKGGTSRVNYQEAEKVTNIVKQFLIEGDLTRSDMGIITPYSGQVNYLNTLFHKDTLFITPSNNDIMEEGEYARTQIIGGLNVASVDGFQGREKEVIIFSAVRSNDKGNLGFLADWRRLNVSLTRARRGLIVVGNMYTLSTDPHWHAWLVWMQSQNLIIDLEMWEKGKIVYLSVSNEDTEEHEVSWKNMFINRSEEEDMSDNENSITQKNTSSKKSQKKNL